MIDSEQSKIEIAIKCYFLWKKRKEMNEKRQKGPTKIIVKVIYIEFSDYTADLCDIREFSFANRKVRSERDRKRQKIIIILQKMRLSVE